MVSVVKRDGRREEFVPEKIVVSAVKAGAPPDEARRIAQAVERVVHEEISTEEVRRRVLEQLRGRNVRWEQNWLVYDRAIKKRETQEIAQPAAR
ncbi:ATPase [Methanoculleus sp. FWC-SCC1]|uniref:ATPase n=1 Tax=Methanoculleus frigidifontis TaxID=2584085 RepID=A0ABT8MD34_9EURY|nr:ATP cone domain-containing protein [Methanoculleus sp. FWC-SCC1]MDN7025838.1 ATPase [Methanoculleus sp. FWC-SCC1]